MPNRIIWDASYTSRGTITTSDDSASVADGSRSKATCVLDNGTNLDITAMFEVVLYATATGPNSFLKLFMLTAPDGTNYNSGSSDVDPGISALVAGSLSVSTSTSVQYLHSGFVTLEPANTKIIVGNELGGTLPSCGLNVNVYTVAEELQ